MFEAVTSALSMMISVSLWLPATGQRLNIDIRSLGELNVHLASSEPKTVGFLSEGNFHAVQNELDPSVEPLYFESYNDLHAALQSDELIAGLVSGTPSSDMESMYTFGSDQISLRAILVQPNQSNLLLAVDAAIANTIEGGTVDRLIQTHAPYEMLLAHSCKPSADHFEWPENLRETYGDTIVVSSLGPYNWGATDGDYTVEPPTGFWPDYYRQLERHFLSQYGMRFTRAWYPTSAQVLQSVQNGTAHMTEPYMMLGAAHGDTSRKTSFGVSCTTGATQDKYITRRSVEQAASAASGNNELVTCRPQLVTAATLAAAMFLLMIPCAVLLLTVRRLQKRTVVHHISVDRTSN